MECVAYLSGSRPTPLTRWLTSRAYWRVVRCRSGPPRPGNKHWSKLSIADPEVVVHRLPGHLGQLEANWSAGLALADVSAVDRVAVGCHVIDAESDEVAASQLAVDGEIEERQVPHAPPQ